MISVDTLRPDHLGCYGYHRPTSPRIDRFAAEGALFENAISSTSWTLPAHAALFTGLPDTVHGCTDTERPLADSRTTLAERLKEQGYATVGFFSGPYLHPVFGLGQGFDKYIDCTSYAKLNEQLAQARGTVDGMAIWKASHRDVTNPHVYEEVSAWLEANKRSPFFMFIHMWDVHFDFIPPPPYNRMFDPHYQGSLTGRNFLFDQSINAGMPKRDRDHLIALYDGEIAWTDAHVGRILDDLDALGLKDSTLVVLLSDHGTEFFEHGQKSHRQTLYDEVIRIPLIVRFPGRIGAGQRYGTQVRLIDVLPTILDLAGLEPGRDVMGQSLAPLLSGAALKRDNLAVSELFSKDPRYPKGHKLRSFRRPDWKLISDLNKQHTSVFDLRADPGESTPLGDPQAAVVQTALRDARQGLESLKAFRAALPTSGGAPQIPPEVLAKLRSLGYVDDEEEEEEEEEEEPEDAPAESDDGG